MSEKTTLLEIDAQTGVAVERELTTDEIAQRKKTASEEALLLAESESKIAARESALAKLAALGLTEEEIGAL
jgi:hypothetical protein